MSKSISSIPACLLFLILLFSAPPAAAQETGVVRGTVTATGGAPISGARVIIEGTDLGALTGPEGEYVITGVPAGNQVVQVSSLGYETYSRRVLVPAGGTVVADFALAVAALALEEIVVTGTANPVVKLETSTAITTMSNSEIDLKAPRSTADLLEVVPGFYVESSGGVVGNNVWARGIPQPGSYRYIGMYVNGLPIYPATELSFTNIDLLFRVDETIRTMEAVRGGSAAIFASNAPGGLINFISKTGGPERKGLIEFTVGDYSLFRLDLNYGGPIGDDKEWRFNVGGFYRYDMGIRSPDFPANHGGQIKANITRLFDDGGHFRIYARYLNDRNIFYLPIPLTNPDDPEGLEGFDPNYGTLTSIDAARVQIPTPDGQTLEHNLRDGIHTQLRSITAEVQFNVGDGWTITNKARAMSADIDYNAIFSLSPPIDAVLYAQEYVEDLGGIGFEYSLAHPHRDETFNPLNANGNGLVIESGWWNVQKRLSMFANDLSVSKDFADHRLTAGLFVTHYTADERWNFNDVLLTVGDDEDDDPLLLDLTVFVPREGPSIPEPRAVHVTENGFVRYGSFYRNTTNSAQVFAFYVSDAWQATESLRIDGGLRLEHARFSGNVEELETFNLGDPTTLADNEMVWGSGEFRPYSFDFTEYAASIGANYTLMNNLAVFGRVTRGYRMPDFDRWAGGPPFAEGESEEIYQAAGGVKYGSPYLGLFATVFYSTLGNIPFTDVVQSPDTTTDQTIVLERRADATTIGLELEAAIRPIEHLRIDLTTTIQRPQYTSMTFLNPELAEKFSELDFEGNQIRRLPNIMLSVRPVYTFPERFQSLKIYGTYEYIGLRYADDANNVDLPAYSVLSAGLAFDLSDRVKVRVIGDNLTNTIGLTEGNPRLDQVVGVEQEIYMARPILGRSFEVSVAYSF